MGHPLILHVDGEPMARALAKSWPEAASRFVAAFWPGPLTIIVPKTDAVPLEATGGIDTVGLRAPRHPVALALIRAVGEPIAAPSANAHMHVSPTTAEHVVRSLGDAVDLVLDGGPCAHGIESTVLTLAGEVPRVLRPGAVSLEELRAIDPRVIYEAAAVETDAARASPGMASKHYAPGARVVLAPPDGLASALGEARRAAGADHVAAIVWSDAGRILTAGMRHVFVLPADAGGYAQGLYAALHGVDVPGVDVVVVEAIPTGDPTWWAVADRLERAAR